MAYQAAVRLSTSACIRAGLGNPVREAGSQKSVNELGTDHVLSHKRTKMHNYNIFAECLIPELPEFHTSSLVADSVSVSP